MYFLCICGALALAAIGLNLVVIGILVGGVMVSQSRDGMVDLHLQHFQLAPPPRPLTRLNPHVCVF